MPEQVDPRHRAIAARLTSLNRELFGLPARSDQTVDTERAARIALQKAAGRYAEDTGSGPEFPVERYLVDRLVQRGEFTPAEADAYMASLYPQADFAGGRWGSIAEAQRGADAAEEAAALDGRSSTQVALDGQREASQARNVGSARDAPTGIQPVLVDELPADYDAAALHRILQDMAEHITRGLSLIQTGRVPMRTHTVDGGVLRPGSVPADAIDPRQLEEACALPGPEDAIDLTLAPDRELDTFVAGGPGRIWRVTGSVPRGTAPGARPTRYRLVVPGQRFGVMSMELTSATVPTSMVRYGIVIHGIPHDLGRAPTGILAALSVGDPPTALASTSSVGTFGVQIPAPRVLWERKAQSDFSVPFAAVRGSDAILAPSAVTHLPTMGGLTISLVNGRDARQVHEELCSADGLGQGIRPPAHGPAVAIPPGRTPGLRTLAPPTMANALSWNGTTGSGARHTHLTDTTDLATVTRLSQGMPFRYSDCAALVATKETFSLVIRCRMTVSRTLSGTWGTPAVWADNGLETLGTSPRTWAIDAIVY